MPFSRRQRHARKQISNEVYNIGLEIVYSRKLHTMETCYLTDSTVSSCSDLLWAEDDGCYPIQKVSCTDHEIHQPECAACVSMHFFFGTEGSAGPLLTPSGDAVRFTDAANGGDSMAVVEPRGCPGALSQPLRIVRAQPCIHPCTVTAHVVPTSGGPVLYLGSTGLSGGGVGASKEHKCNPAMVYRCRDCTFVCPKGACMDCCIHKNHNCLEQRKATFQGVSAEQIAAERESLVAAAIGKDMGEIHRKLDRVSTANEQSATASMTSRSKNKEAFVFVQPKTGYISYVDVLDDAPSDARQFGLIPEAGWPVPVLKFRKWKELLDKKEFHGTQNLTSDCRLKNQDEKDLIHSIVNRELQNELSIKKFHSLWAKIKNLQFDTEENLKVLIWCLDIKYALPLASVCDFLRMLIEINYSDIFELRGSFDPFLVVKEKWLKQYQRDDDHLSPEDRNRLFHELATTYWGPDLCKVFQDFIYNSSSIEFAKRLFSLIREHKVPDAIILFILTHFSKEEINNIEFWKNLVLSQTLINHSNLEISKLIKMLPAFRRLIELSVPHEFLKEILKNKEHEINKHTEEFIRSLEILIDYRISQNLIVKLLQKNWDVPVKIWPEVLDRSIISAIFKKPSENKMSDLIKVLKTLNEDMIENLESMCESVYRMYNKRLDIKTEDKQIRKCGIYITPIKGWRTVDVRLWAALIKKKIIPEVLEETIAVLMRAVQLNSGPQNSITPRRVQILALLILLHPHNDKGRLAQINTGEGKSMIVAMLAAVHALRGKYVDVVTTSTDLAEREAKRTRGFFEMLQLTVSDNVSNKNSTEDLARAYSCNVVYGTTLVFIGDVLRQEFLGDAVRKQRRFDVVIADEVDSLLFDNRSSCVRLSQSLPGMTFLEPLLGAIWERAHRLAASIITAHNGKAYFADNPQEAERLQNNASDADHKQEVRDRLDFIISKTQHHAEQLIRNLEEPERREELEEYEEFLAVEREILKIQTSRHDTTEKMQVEKEEQNIPEEENASSETGDGENPELETKYEEHDPKKENYKSIESQTNKLKKKLQELPWIKNERYAVLKIPKHLRKFTMCQIPYWVRNAVNAIEKYEKNAHYTVQNNRIVPISYDENGEYQTNTEWGDGITQFLQMKEGLLVSAETISTNFLSNVSFFLRYGSNIYGVSGTLGEKGTQNFFQNMYKVDFYVIPAHSSRSIVDNHDSPYLCKELQPLILHSYDDWFNTVVNHTIHHALMGRAVLVIFKFVQQVKKCSKILSERYDREKVQEYAGDTAFCKYTVDSGDVVVATNIAGRGTDLTPTPEVEALGGVYVLGTFLPESFRVEMQNMGRTARKGARGLGQFILHAPPHNDLVTLRQRRAKREEEACKLAERVVEHVLMQDRLFGAFCVLENSLLPSKYNCELEILWPKLKKECEDYLDSKTLNIEETLLKLKKEHQENVKQHCSHRPSREGNTVLTEKEKEEIDDKFENHVPEYRKKEREKELQRFCKKKHDEYPLELINILQTGKEYTPTKRDLCKKFDWGDFERQGLEERWALWLRAKHFEDQTNINNAPDQFQKEFEAKIQDDALEDKLIENPFYYVRKGNAIYTTAMSLPLVFFSRENSLEKSIKCYDEAIHLDDAFSFHARFNKAFTLLSFFWNENEKQDEAYDELKKAKELIEYTHKPTLLSLHAILAATGAKVGTVRHIQHQLNILEQEMHFIDKAMEVLEKCKKERRNVRVTAIPLIEALEVCDEDHTLAAQEAIDNGLTQFFSINVMPPIAWGSVLTLTEIALVQILVGGVIALMGNVAIGTALVLEGVSDLVTAITSIFTGGVEWGKWAVTKAASLALSVMSAGWRAIRGGFSVLKTAVQAIKANPLHAVYVGYKTTDHVISNLFNNNSITVNCAIEAEAWLTDMARCETMEEKLGLAIKRIMQEVTSNSDFFKTIAYIDQYEGNSSWEEVMVREAINIYGSGKFSRKGEGLQELVLRQIQRLRNEPSDAPVLPDDLDRKVTSFAEEFVHYFASSVKSKFEDLIKRDKKRLEAQDMQGNKTFRAEVFASGPSTSTATYDGDACKNVDALTERLSGAVCQCLWRDARVQLFVKSRKPATNDATADVLQECDVFLKSLPEQLRVNKEDVGDANADSHDYADSAADDPFKGKCDQLNIPAREALNQLSSSAQLNAPTVQVMANAMRRDVILFDAHSGNIVLRTEENFPEKPIMLLIDQWGCIPLTDLEFTRSQEDNDLLRAALVEGGTALSDALGGEKNLRAAMKRYILLNPANANKLFTCERRNDGEQWHDDNHSPPL